jgi:predicted signal transduction protein with EAL and GGDEF domain
VDPDDAVIVIAIIGLAHHLQLRVIAEGVETPEQMDFLRSHGCDEAQGYLLARPMPADMARAWRPGVQPGQAGGSQAPLEPHVQQAPRAPQRLPLTAD